MQIENLLDDRINEQLEQVKQNMEKKLSHGDVYLNDSLNHVKLAKGKMLRPLLLLIGTSFGRYSKKKQSSYVELATAVETLHMATLIHDDVIDEAKLRRGQESIQSKYSKSYAVYMGDFLLSQSFLMIANLDVDKEVGIRLAKAINQICIGEMKQHKWRYDTAVIPMNYLRIVSGKTAALFTVSLSSGALQAKVPNDTIKILGRIGYYIGMAFQLIDDLLDYVGDEDTVGKDLKSDLIKGYYSLPVIFALNSEFGYDIKELLNNGITGEEEVDQVIALVKKSGGIQRTEEMASRYTKKAMGLVMLLPNGKGKQTLKKLIPLLLERVY